jgi:predicted ATPase
MSKKDTKGKLSNNLGMVSVWDCRVVAYQLRRYPALPSATLRRKQIATDLRDAFVDGVWFVDLAALNDPELVPAAIARARRYESGATPLAILTRALRDQHALLLLDNFEQVLGAAPVVALLLAAAPDLAILATSRAPLRLTSEQEYAVSPLELPPEQYMHALDTYAAVQLFVRRARVSSHTSC